MKNKWIAALLVICVFWCGLLSVANAEIEEINAARNSIVRVFAVSSSSKSAGTGICVGRPGENVEYIATNRHVIFEDDTGKYYPYIVVVLDGLDENTTVSCSIISAWVSPDLAILKLEVPTNRRTPAKFRSAATVKTGDKLYSIGYPGSADDLKQNVELLPSAPEDATLTEGLVSNTMNTLYDGLVTIQCDAAVNHGNSGGPMLDQDGYVVAQTMWSHRTDRSINYPQRIDYVLSALDQLSIPYFLDSGGSLRKVLWMVTIGVTALSLLSILWAVVQRKQKRKPQTANGPLAGGHEHTVPVGVDKTVAVERRDATVGIRYTLVGVNGPLKEKSFPLVHTLTIGRDAARCQVVCPNDTPGVSGAHCRMDAGVSGVTLTDLGSSYGTRLNGTKLEANRPYPIHRGESFEVGSEQVRFTLLG